MGQPFQGLNPDTYHDSFSNWLDLIDGASNIENVPIGPLFVKARELDVIVALVGSAVELDEEVIDLLLRGNGETGLDELGGDGVVDVRNGLQHT